MLCSFYNAIIYTDRIGNIADAEIIDLTLSDTEEEKSFVQEAE